MDADETLRTLRDAFADHDEQAAFEAFEALDHWLSSGGFLPSDWTEG